MDNQNYRSIFAEILSAYSLVKHSSLGNLYIKHFSYVEAGDLDTRYFEYIEIAKKHGLKTYKDRENFILSQNLWSEQEESKLKDEEKLLEILTSTRNKDYLYTRRKQYKEQIKDCEKRFNLLRIKKDHLIGSTAEEWANKKLTTFKIENSYFREKSLNTPLITNDNEYDFSELIEMYNVFQKRFNHKNIKKIALSSFFTEIFNLSSEDIYHFYGKPIVELTEFQCNLVMWGKYFKSILQEYGKSISNEIKSNPEELIEWIEINQNAREQKIIGNEQNEDGGMSIVGARKEDYDYLGIKVDTNNSLSKALKKSGGILDKDALFNMTK